ncbi:hypothetical protein AB0368_10090 [Actinoplanes sp. NPDC051475]|uniref:hypothetical protein n=1 Tax=Actinoplanes sp. NPDC051475 TaxID=3157225 RepID=UPI00344B9625
MRAGRLDRLWMIIGLLVIGLLTAVTYFAVVSPTRAEANELIQQAEGERDQAVSSRRQIAKLAEEKKNEGKLIATRDAYRDALPSGSGVPAFLRQLQASGTDLGVDVSGITVGTPAEAKGVSGVWEIQIQLIAEGDVGDLDDFLRQLQGSDQKRAVLVQSAGLEIGNGETPTRLNLTLTAFVAPPAGSGAPAVTTD